MNSNNQDKQRQAERKREQRSQLENEIQLANYGKQVLDNPAFKQVFAMMQAHCIEVFSKTKVEQDDVRREAWRTMKNLDKLEAFFKTSLETGKMAEQSLNLLTTED